MLKRIRGSTGTGRGARGRKVFVDKVKQTKSKVVQETTWYGHEKVVKVGPRAVIETTAERGSESGSLIERRVVFNEEAEAWS